ncbi:zinc finger protein 135 isoform X3 [Oryzias melastigma]|uniref:zinc finger protein 135 isoform X3 n=1 Tax=Oryzias melastigma TaxID=30732 RepID=UPI000CF7DBF5|nr:zinc finger protein 135 isoform X3 [Oryzias melastigma]
MEQMTAAVGRKLSTSDLPENLQCVQCFITFRDAKAKERHTRKYHGEQYKQHLQQTNTLFICYKCDRYFVHPEELSQHQQTHAADEKPFLCTYCQKPFSLFSEFSKHKRYECTLRGRFCRDCNTLFPGPSALRRHRKAVHSGHPDRAGGDTLQCSMSNRCFPTEEGLLPQEEFAHFLSCDYSVNDCDADPQDKSQSSERQCGISDEELNYEEIQQKGGPAERERSEDSDGSASAELRIPCPAADCDCTFPSVEALRIHRKNHHGPPLQKGLCSECPKCGKTFARQSALKTHQTFHCRVKKRFKKR